MQLHSCNGYTICCRSVNFINNYLASDSHIIRSIAYRSVFFSRALSPLGRNHNAQFCCQRYGVSLFDARSIVVNYIKHWFFSKIDTDLMSRVVLLLELLFIRDESFFCLDQVQIQLRYLLASAICVEIDTVLIGLCTFVSFFFSFFFRVAHVLCFLIILLCCFAALLCEINNNNNNNNDIPMQENRITFSVKNRPYVFPSTIPL